MATANGFDSTQAHRFFSAECFNRCWSLLDKPQRTADEDRDLELVALASLWHWTQRADCKPRNLSIGYWQVARVYAVLKHPANALRYAELCAAISRDEPAFYRGYACEALARAALAAGDVVRAREELRLARDFAAQSADAEERAALETDLASIDAQLAAP